MTEVHIPRYQVGRGKLRHKEAEGGRSAAWPAPRAGCKGRGARCQAESNQ